MARNPLPPPPSDATLTLNPPLSRPPSNARQRGQWRCDDWGLWFFSPGASPINAFSQNREPTAPRSALLSPFVFRPAVSAPRLDATRGVTLLRPVAFGCSFCPNWIREPWEEDPGTVLFRCSQHDSAVTCNFFCCSLCFSFFLFRSLLLLFLRSISRWTGRWKGGERERNERATTPSGLVLPTLDRRLFSRRSPPNPVYLPEIYIYIYYIFVGVSPLFFTVRWKKRYERFAPCIFPPTEEERIFIYVCRYVRAPWAICSKTRRGRRIIKI